MRTSWSKQSQLVHWEYKKWRVPHQSNGASCALAHTSRRTVRGQRAEHAPKPANRFGTKSHGTHHLLKRTSISSNRNQPDQNPTPTREWGFYIAHSQKSPYYQHYGKTNYLHIPQGLYRWDRCCSSRTLYHNWGYGKNEFAITLQ